MLRTVDAAIGQLGPVLAGPVLVLPLECNHSTRDAVTQVAVGEGDYMGNVKCQYRTFLSNQTSLFLPRIHNKKIHIT